MIPLAVSKTLKSSGSGRLVLKTNPARRVTALVIFLLLLVAMIIAVEPETDFSGRRLIGTIVFLLLLAASLSTSLYAWQLVCDRPSAGITVRRSLLVVTLYRVSFPWEAVRTVVLERVVLIKGKEREQEPYATRPGGEPAAALPPSRGWLDLRSRQLASLHLDLGGRTLLLESSTDHQTLAGYGRRLADFLQVPFSDREQH